MIAFISICYAGLYVLIFNKLGLLKKTTANVSTFSAVGVAMLAAIVFSWYTYSPMSSDARVFRYVIPIVPNVKGQLIEVPVESMQTIKKGDLLYRIDPTPFEFNVLQLQAQLEQQSAQLRLAQINVDRAEELVAKNFASQIDLDKWTAERDAATAAIAATQAQLDNANWQLAETEVNAPSDGYAVNVQIRPGSFVTTVIAGSSLAFISNESTEIVASFSQSSIRRIEVGNEVEVLFSTIPGQVYRGEVTKLGKAGGQSQFSANSRLPSLTGAPVTDRWAVRVKLDDPQLAIQLPQGAGGTMAVYTNGGKPVHIISRVALRMNAWLSYLTSP
jgi:multidrug resistance efflux pump